MDHWARDSIYMTAFLIAATVTAFFYSNQPRSETLVGIVPWFMLLIPIPLFAWRFMTFSWDEEIKWFYRVSVRIEEDPSFEGRLSNVRSYLMMNVWKDSFKLWALYKKEFPATEYQYPASMFIDYFYFGKPRYEIFGDRGHREADISTIGFAIAICALVLFLPWLGLSLNSVPPTVLLLLNVGNGIEAAVIAYLASRVAIRDFLPRLTKKQMESEFRKIHDKINTERDSLYVKKSGARSGTGT